MATIRASRVYQQQMSHNDVLIKTVNTLSWAHYSHFQRQNHTNVIQFECNQVRRDFLLDGGPLLVHLQSKQTQCFHTPTLYWRPAGRPLRRRQLFRESSIFRPFVWFCSSLPSVSEAAVDYLPTGNVGSWFVYLQDDGDAVRWIIQFRQRCASKDEQLEI